MMPFLHIDDDHLGPIRRGFGLWVSIGVVLLTTAFPPSAPAQEARGPIKSVEVVILSTMLTDRAGVGEWGFSALVEADGRRILFDTGARPETVLRNARELKVDLAGVTDVILSHHHGDHTGGLLTLRRELSKRNPDALKRAYVGAGIFLSRPAPDGRETNEALAVKEEFEALGGSFVVVERPTELFPGAWLTGPVPRTHPERNWSLKRTIRYPDGRQVEDNVPEDMSLVLDTEKGLVLVSGCGHAGIINTLEYARGKVRETRVYAALGGFHLFEADDAVLDWTAAKLRPMAVANLLGAHCTGIEPVYDLRQRLGLGRANCSSAPSDRGSPCGEGSILEFCHDRRGNCWVREPWLWSRQQGSEEPDLPGVGTDDGMEEHLAQASPKLTLVGEDDAPDQVDHRVLRIEPDRLIAIGQGAVEVVRVPQGQRASEERVRRPRIQANHGVGVLQFPGGVPLGSPVLAAHQVRPCERRLEPDGLGGVGDRPVIVSPPAPALRPVDQEHPVGRVEPDGLIVIGDGLLVLLFFLPGMGPTPIGAPRFRVESDGLVGVGQRTIDVILLQPGGTPVEIRRCEAGVEPDGGAGVADRPTVFHGVEVGQSAEAVGRADRGSRAIAAPK